MASLQALSTGFLSDMVEHFLLSFKLSYYIDIYECFLIVKKKKSFLHYYFTPKPVLSQPAPIPFPFSEVFSAGVHPCGHIYNILSV